MTIQIVTLLENLGQIYPIKLKPNQDIKDALQNLRNNHHQHKKMMDL